ncbi:DUF4190 domain-containing protein [Planomonospora parontospora]|nr:DUF4190 domain-containing protein [Planomonospora parontospora]
MSGDASDPRSPYSPPYPPVYCPAPSAPSAPASGLATASLVVGIPGILGGWCLFGLPCMAAIALGHAAMRETKTGRRGGHGAAIAGLILGYVCVAPMALITILPVTLYVIGSSSP